MAMRDGSGGSIAGDGADAGASANAQQVEQEQLQQHQEEWKSGKTSN